MTAYYNEIDPYCADRLRNLIAKRKIMPGVVDTRSIADVQPTDLMGYTRVHLFAGIAGWELALQLAGWPADVPVWTGSCPCPPFSAAGKKKSCPRCEGKSVIPHPFKTGIFVCCDETCDHHWYADGRHLWPEMLRLIIGAGADCVFGEQVASDDGLAWLDGVFAGMEGAGYTCRAADLCSAGIGAANIRQRLYWVAYAKGGGFTGRGRTTWQDRQEAADDCIPCGLELTNGGGQPRQRAEDRRQAEAAWPSEVGRMGDAIQPRLEGHAEHVGDCDQPGRLATPPTGSVAEASSVGRLADAKRTAIRGSEPETPGATASGVQGTDGQRERLRPDAGAGSTVPPRRLADTDSDGCDAGRVAAPATRYRDSAGTACGTDRPGPARPPDLDWRNVDWLFCRDGKWRPVESGTFPLADGVPERVARLKAYGNAIDPRVAAMFIESFLQTTPAAVRDERRA